MNLVSEKKVVHLLAQNKKMQYENLVTYAVQGEFTELKFPGLIGEEEVHIGYIRTGVGKVKSAYYVSEVLNQAKPGLGDQRRYGGKH